MSTFLITGCNRGIGLELARQTAARGDHVIATCRDPAAAAHLQALAGAHPALVTLLALDVADPASIAAVATTIGARKIDVLINNAGIIGPARQSTLDMDFDGFALTLMVNTLAPLRIAQAFLPNLREGAGGKIATITSGMGSMSYAKSDRIAYRAAKAAVNKVMQGLASDAKPLGVAVLLLHPGWVRTDMGGAGASISASDSAAGILAQIDALTLARSGMFLDHAGKTMPW